MTSPNLSSVNQLPIAGKPVGSLDTYEHPQWVDGTLILVGQDVRTRDGWRGFVESVAREEITVAAYVEELEDDWSEQFAPDELRRIDG